MARRPRRKCYACDRTATGTCDRYDFAEERIVPACTRHRDANFGEPWKADACIYCGGPTRAGSLDIDGDPAHRVCHFEQYR